MTGMRRRRWRGRVIIKLLSIMKMLEADDDDHGLDIEQQSLAPFETSGTY